MQPLKQFAFDVPENARPGVTLKVEFDGVELHIVVPQGVLPGSRITLEKAADGTWAITQVVHLEKARMVAPPDKHSPESLAADLAGPHTCQVVLETSKGPIKLRVVPPWAPKGCQRFLQLVVDQYFTDLAIYRAVPGFLIQFGLMHEIDPRVSNYEAIQDDVLRNVPIEEGMVCFAAAESGARCATIIIFLGKFETLGRQPWETPIGRVCPESMPVLRSIYTGYGDMPQVGGHGPNPHLLEERGNSYIREKFPNCDFVKTALWVARD